ncbi:Surfactin synthase thioesterase subunit [Amycolatopsis xylanica]|uniref:Surfactin synthase thioesterase subunit n=1 Tax=Amycolatopsis xylanica TaxID=589385 RepID=A0A1H3DBQ4_9PSEU|nr:alpha/beta fold hydrolase [Amycolatopsis xylanica]SDX63787.1 Surfactin synthase thioesterase subunit [Amycolatopsis xylanica]
MELLPFWRGRGDRPPVFCLPHAGGGASAYRNLAKDLKPEVDLQPVQLPGREHLAGKKLVDDVPTLVELIAKNLEPLLDKPFALMGHSMGALLAAELTAWLERNHKPGPELLIVSSYFGDFRHNRVAHLEETDDELVDEIVKLGGTAPEILQHPEMREIVLDVMRNDMRLVRNYRPTYDRLAVPILAVGGDSDPEVPLDGLAAWRLRTSARCELHVLRGGHFAALEHPRFVAEKVSSALTAPEDILLDILRTRLEDQDITLEDDFYAAGGDSVIALGVIADAKERGVKLGLRDLLTAATIGELVPLLAKAEPEEEQPEFDGLTEADRALLPQNIADAYPASSLQVGLIYLCELAGDPSLYNDLIGMRVKAPFDAAKFRSAVGALMKRHPALRSSFDLATFSTATHLIWQDAEPPVEVQIGDEKSADELVKAWRDKHLATGIDWDSAPAFRCHVVALPDSFRLTFAIHHAIIDGWSFARLLVELLTFYDAELTHEKAELPPVPADGYRKFVALERQAIESQEAAGFWKAEADVPPLLLPDRPIDAAPDPTQTRRLPLIKLDRLRTAAEEIGVPLKSLFLAVHGFALAQATGRHHDVVTGLVVNGRPELPGSDHLVGLFLNTVPLRLRTTAGTWADRAHQAWTAEQNLLAHRRFPVSEIEQALGRPAFDVSFNFTHFHSYRDLDGIKLEADSWWAYDKASFALGVDVMIDSPDLGTGIVIAYDPEFIDGKLVDAYLLALESALRSVVSPC